MIPYGLSVATQILVARRDGESRPKDVVLVTRSSLLLMLSLGIVLALFMRFGLRPVLEQFMENPPVVDQIQRYLNWRAWEFIPGSLMITMVGFYTGLARMRTVFYGTAVILSVNLVFNYLLVFGVGPFPRLEIAGAGLASLIATLAGTIYLLGVSRWTSLHQAFPVMIRGVKWWDKATVKRVIEVGSPVVGQHLTGLIVWVYFFQEVEGMGKDELAISNAIKSTYLILGVSAWGIGNASNTVISNLIGQGKSSEVMKTMYQALILCVLCAIPGLLLANFVPDLLLGIFVPDRPDLVELGRDSLRVTGIALLTLGASSAIFRSTTGTGATRFTLFTELFVLPLYIIYVYWAIEIQQGSLALAWASEFVYWTFLGLSCYWYMRSGRWKKLKI
jgi:Na+-driven multidrug efflux pump